MSHSLRFPGTKKLDASFPSVLRDNETWNTAREELKRAMMLSKEGNFFTCYWLLVDLNLRIIQRLPMKTTPLFTHKHKLLTLQPGANN